MGRLKDWKAVAEGNGIKYITFWSRLNRGWPVERAATETVYKRPDCDWMKKAEENGISIQAYRARVNKLGWSPKEAATKPTKRPDQDWIEIAKKNGIKRKTYINRVDNLFWEPEDAASIKPLTNCEVLKLAREASREYEQIKHERINNDPDNLFKLTPQHVEIAEKNGITKATVHSRIYLYGWSVDEAINEPVRRGAEKPEGYHEWLKIALDNGISYETYRSRVGAGWSLEDAAKKPKISKNQRKVHSQEAVDLAKKNGVSYWTFVSRIERGWTEEEAFGTSILPKGKFLNEERANLSKQGFEDFKGFRLKA